MAVVVTYLAMVCLPVCFKLVFCALLRASFLLHAISDFEFQKYGATPKTRKHVLSRGLGRRAPNSAPTPRDQGVIDLWVGWRLEAASFE